MIFITIHASARVVLFVQNRRYPNNPPCMAYFSIYIRHSESNKCPANISIIITRSWIVSGFSTLRKFLVISSQLTSAILTSYLQASGFMKKRCYQKGKKTSTRCESQVFHPLFGGLAVGIPFQWQNCTRSQSQASERRRVTRRSALPALVWNHLSRWVF